MDLLFLGTGAAHGVPEPFCRCASCEHARRVGGRDVRGRSALLVDGDLLIDLGPDVSLAGGRFGASLASVHTALITHAHADHFAPDVLLTRRSESLRMRPPTLTVYGEPPVVKALREWEPYFDDLALAVVDAAPGNAFQTGRYRVEAYAAAHDQPLTERPLLWAAEDGERSFLYACDTGPFPEETWAALRQRSRPLDLVILEETMGASERASERHMNLRTFAATAHRLRAEGILQRDGLHYATHLSHENPPHEELTSLLADCGARAAYDGLSLHLGECSSEQQGGAR